MKPFKIPLILWISNIFWFLFINLLLIETVLFFSAAIETLTEDGNMLMQNFQCNICMKTYKNIQCLNQHLRYDCGKGKPFHCTICRYSAKRKSHLDIHLQSHSRKPWFCPKCNIQYSRIANYENHIINFCRLPPPFKCPQCNFLGFKPNDLNTHFKKKHSLPLRNQSFDL